MSPVTSGRRGALYGACAYLIWGLFPLYWPLLEPSSALEVLAHRILWSVVAVLVLLGITRRLPQVRAAVRDRRRLAQLALAAVVIGINWGTYIYGVSNDRVLETSLGYFVNPIVTVLLAVLVLGERLRPVQWVALGAAFVAVVVLTVENGSPPWIALVLAFSFGMYGLLKKTVGVGAVEGLAIETVVLLPVAAAYVLVLGVSGQSTFGTEGLGHAGLVAVSGIITAVPLLLFGAAASRVQLTTLGLLQYLAPTVQFFLGITLFHEPLPLVKLVGFVLVWFGLALFTADLVRHHRQQLRLTVAAPG
ncbi:MAG: RarD protein superfamily transporter [Frankiales bacterium]|nr:RarD protein superfamily transporter [Frankiales bacterium]